MTTEDTGRTAEVPDEDHDQEATTGASDLAPEAMKRGVPPVEQESLTLGLGVTPDQDHTATLDLSRPVPMATGKSQRHAAEPLTYRHNARDTVCIHLEQTHRRLNILFMMEKIHHLVFYFV
ncbi:hypothetical protein DPMN_160496 [Dreissena polymorpha]|uniref:Uncharacterized protein n=1 Tax=Dreissena polymorpha TaxID=45954 RepID=A0A9D4EN96_DREPO|nr:hypothetical protein DPMN_160496 [Dreissena polymorpha]